MTIGRLDNESAAYRKIRDELLRAEIELKDHVERVAELRRKLPLDTEVEDYLFEEGPRDLSADGEPGRIRLSDLFDDPNKPLLLYQFMYGAAQEKPCPMCSMWIDGFNGVARHLRQTLNFAIVAQAEVARIRAWARERRWNDLRLLSAAPSTFKTDLGFQDEDGAQMPGLSVFAKTKKGLRHFWSGSAHLDEENYRGLDLYTPVWNLMDLIPEGRGDWMPKGSYT